MGLTLCSPGICAAEVMSRSCLSRDGRYFSCRAVIGGGIKAAVTKVKDSELIFWVLEILKNKNWEEHEGGNKHGHLIFSFIYMKSSCFDKLRFQRHVQDWSSQEDL